MADLSREQFSLQRIQCITLLRACLASGQALKQFSFPSRSASGQACIEAILE